MDELRIKEPKIEGTGQPELGDKEDGGTVVDGKQVGRERTELSQEVRDNRDGFVVDGTKGGKEALVWRGKGWERGKKRWSRKTRSQSISLKRERKGKRKEKMVP